MHTKEVVATAHLDHDPNNNLARNLKALCQRCHMLHDREEHRRQRWLTLRARKALGGLSSGRIAADFRTDLASSAYNAIRSSAGSLPSKGNIVL